MSKEVARLDSRSIQAAAEIRGQVNMVQAVMGEVMQKDVHYGTIPGTPKPTLYQAGAQVLCATFHFRPDYEVMEREVGDGLVRYSVKCRLFHQQTGIEVATGVGTCSSGEAKYMWRRPICKEEFDETPEDQRRKLWKKGYQGAKPTQDMQVRTNPADQENTILKMASKRAYIQAVLNATAASDMFTQDVEDLPEGYAAEGETEVKKSATVKAKETPPEAKQEAAGEVKQPEVMPEGGEPVELINDGQRKMLFAVMKSKFVLESDLKSYLINECGIQSGSTKDIPKRMVNDIKAWLEKMREEAPEPGSAG